MPSWDTSHVSYPLWYDRVRYSLSTHLIVGFWLPDLESDDLELAHENAKHGAKMEQNMAKLTSSDLENLQKKYCTACFTCSQTPRNTCGSSVRSLSRIIRTHEPGPASDGCNEVWSDRLREVRRTTWKFHQSREEAQCDGCYGDGHARQKVILWDALHLVLLRCGFHAVTRPRKPICQVSLALNQPHFVSPFQLRKQKTTTTKTHPILTKQMQHEKWRISVISAFSGHEVKWVKCQISTEGGAELGHETIHADNYGHPPSRFDGQHQPRFKITEWPEKILATDLNSWSFCWYLIAFQVTQASGKQPRKAHEPTRDLAGGQGTWDIPRHSI